MTEPLPNYIRVLRKRAGLSQTELGRLLGYSDEGAVGTHENNSSLPPLIIAIAYSVTFGKPIRDIFPGLYNAVEHTTEKNVTAFEEEIRKTDEFNLREQTMRWLRVRKQLS